MWAVPRMMRITGLPKGRLSVSWFSFFCPTLVLCWATATPQKAGSGRLCLSSHDRAGVGGGGGRGRSQEPLDGWA